ncbi:copper homeostasis protein CutC [Aegicerativicinus sediminis]|uniref:copper homeostasis protein CutC n=1 Tax=Aegicerativicinus sediminis TaxID=2893202 RepID=UPI001E3A7591|nr:copper homeostasis protein CutC [Aegicerativicinus sediminis]
MLLEICAANYQSALNAELGGADRIELCSELGVGGITPSYGLVSKVIEKLDIPVFVLIRPRSGSFVYSEEELSIMKADIEFCKEIGCSGIVSGVLKPNFEVDIEATNQLVDISNPLPFTFHRAFDLTPNSMEALDKIIDLGIDRVLTSGQKTSAELGMEILTKLKNYANKQVTIMPGGGVTLQNIGLFIEAGFREIHCSASNLVQEYGAPIISFNSEKFLDEGKEFQSDIAIIKGLKNTIGNKKF